MTKNKVQQLLDAIQAQLTDHLEKDRNFPWNRKVSLEPSRYYNLYCAEEPCPSACIYLTPVMRGEKSYKDTVIIKMYVRRLAHCKRPSAHVGYYLDIRWTWKPTRGLGLMAVYSVKECFEDLVKVWPNLLMPECTSLSADIILSSDLGPIAVLKGESNSTGDMLAEDPNALQLLRLIDAQKPCAGRLSTPDPFDWR
jgi:hypothetical protein